jgi:hypothetical protein
MKAITAAEMQAAAPQIIQLLDKLTGSTDAQEAAEERAAKIAAENADPVTRAEKELLCRELIKKWTNWGILQPEGQGAAL